MTQYFRKSVAATPSSPEVAAAPSPRIGIGHGGGGAAATSGDEASPLRPPEQPREIRELVGEIVAALDRQA
ncbi:MAG: hypothetical protein ABMA13_21875, partial [Chthoniobacteraceae bacterium]